MGRGRGRNRTGSFGNYSNGVQQPFFMSSSGGRISFLKIILLAVVLYFVLRLIIPLVWILVVLFIIFVALKYLVRRF